MRVSAKFYGRPMKGLYLVFHGAGYSARKERPNVAGPRAERDVRVGTEITVDVVTSALYRKPRPRRDSCQTRVMTSEAFCPPKPKLLEMAVASGSSREVFGT